jgi:hypothetical protein
MQLYNDLKESMEDIGVCEAAIAIGVVSYSHGEVAERLEGNKRIVATIEKELKRRWPEYFTFVKEII